MKTAHALLEEFLDGAAFSAPSSTYFPDGLPSGDYESVLLSEISAPKNERDKSGLHNKSQFDITGCRIWFPAGRRFDVEKYRYEVIANSPNCNIYMLELARGISFKLNGPSHSILNLSSKQVSANIRMTGGVGQHFAGCRVLIGQNTFIAGARVILLNTDFLIGHDALWSDEILVQGSNQHGIVELPGMTLVDYPRNTISLDPHVWVGRRAVLTAGCRVGKGSVVGTGALVAKSFPSAAIVGGNPARVIKLNRSWAFHLDKVQERELAILSDLAPAGDAPTWRKLLNSIWFKAASAGAAAALAFELLLELFPAF